MKRYTNKEPMFSSEIQVTETTDPAHADNINAAPMQLLQNTLCNKKSIEQLGKSMGAGNTNEHSTEIKYHTGEYCLKDGMMYKCLKDTEGVWNPENWQKTSPVAEIVDLSRTLNNLISLFGKDEGGNLRKLGAAAYCNVAKNLTTTEENKFLLGAEVGPVIDKRFTTLEEQYESLNSALDDVGFTFKSVSSTASFSDAFNSVQDSNSGNANMAKSLDTMHASIANYANGMHTVTGTNQLYLVFLCKQNNNSYGGLIMSYYMSPPLFFAVSGGTTFRLFVAVTI